MRAPLTVLRLVGYAAAGFALAVGWKLGSMAVDLAMGKDPADSEKSGTKEGDDTSERLWKRSFEPFSR